MLWLTEDQCIRTMSASARSGQARGWQFVQTTLDTWQCNALLLPVPRLVPVELRCLNRTFMGDSMILEKNSQFLL